MIKYFNINDIDNETWNTLQSNGDNSLFTSPDWLSVIEKTYDLRIKLALSYNDQQEILAGIYFADVNFDISTRFLISLPFSDYSKCYYQSKEYLHGLLKDIQKHENVPLILKLAKEDVEVFNNEFIIKRDALLHELDLSFSVDSLWNNLDSKFRNQVRKAQKSNIVTKISHDFKDIQSFWEMHALLRKNKFSEFPQPRQFFTNIWEAYISKNKGFLLNAFLDTHLVASTLFLTEKTTAYYKFNTSNPEYLQYCPNNLIIWNAIEHFKNTGITALDFGLTGKAESYRGLKNFKDGTGAKIYELKVGQLNTDKGSKSARSIKEDVISYSRELIHQDLSFDQIDLFSKYFYKFFI